VRDIDIAVVDSLKVLDPNGRLEKRKSDFGAVRSAFDHWPPNCDVQCVISYHGVVGCSIEDSA
jgi:hypothetical protein